MDRNVIGIVGFLVLLAIGFGLTQMRKGDAADKLLLEAKAAITEADMYEKHREYFDWLVETAHEQVVSDSITTSYGGRRRGSRIEVDYDKYAEDLFARMIELAKNNDYHEVAESLERLVDPDAAERQKQEKAEKKKNAKKK